MGRSLRQTQGNGTPNGHHARRLANGKGFGRQHHGAEGGTRICGPLAGQDEKYGRTGEMGRRAPCMALMETRRTDAGGDLRQRPPDEGGHARQRTHGHQHHAPRPRHRGHSPRNRRQRARGGARRSRHFLSGLRNLQHGERRGVCQPQKPRLWLAHAEGHQRGAPPPHPMDYLHACACR